MEHIGDRYQGATKYDRNSLGHHVLDWENRPEEFKNHDNPLAVYTLPEPSLSGETNLWSSLYNRRSKRVYRDKSLDLELLSALLWAAQGVTASYGKTLFRTAPSAGALFPVETYLMVRDVVSLAPGIYHFRPHKFDLEFLRESDYSKELADYALGQSMIERAQATFIWTAVVERSRWKYRQRAYRYIYLDAGHIGQNLYLAGEALGLGVCTIGAFFDDEVNSLLGVDGIDETVVYMAVAGWPKKEKGQTKE